MQKLGKLGLRQAFWTGLALAIMLGAFASLVWLTALAIREGATVLAAILAALATVGAAMVARYFERKKELEAARREYFGPIYENLAGALAGQTMTERKTAKVAGDFMRKALIYASPSTLKTFREWRQGLLGLPPNTDDWPKHVTLQNALRYEAFIKAMRKDLGVSNFTLQDGDLARSVINDFDELHAEVLVEIEALNEQATDPEESAAEDTRSS
jgi:hypothetical protein